MIIVMQLNWSMYVHYNNNNNNNNNNNIARGSVTVQIDACAATTYH